MEWARILAYITGTVDQELLFSRDEAGVTWSPRQSFGPGAQDYIPLMGAPTA
jgi:hypothetical protein